MRRRIVNAYLSSVISISLVLLLTGIAALLVINAGSVTRYLKENMQVSVLLTDDATEKQAAEYAASLSERPYVRAVRVISKEEGAEELKSMLGEDFLDVFETSPVPVSLELSLHAEYVQPDSLALVTKALEASPLVEDVNSQQTLVQALTTNLARITLILGVFILLLLFISFILIGNTVRLSLYARRFTIHTMRLVGATRAFIRRPFMVSALVQGLVSGAITCGVLYGALVLVRRSFPQISGLFTTDILLMVAGVVLACGVLICLLATFFTVNKLALASEDSLYY